MKSIEDLQKMAKNGEISKKLLENEEFKKEFKKALSEDSGVAATDEQICEVIKNFESALQDEKNLNEAELQEISGGDDKSCTPKTLVSR